MGTRWKMAEGKVRPLLHDHVLASGDVVDPALADKNAAPRPDAPDAPTEPPTQTPVVLTIAGLDPSSGAGLTADLKVFAAHRLYGVAAASALTVQAPRGVRRVEPVSAALLTETLDCLAEEMPLSGIKIGMLATLDNVDAVIEFLARQHARSLHRVPVVLDPVLQSTSGHSLLDPSALDRLRTALLPLVTCVTPNLSELVLLAGIAASPAPSKAEVAGATALLARQRPGLSVIATGGHLAQPHDYVLPAGQTPVWVAGEWVHTPSTRGTGCGYSSALLSNLVRGLPLLEAARAAKAYVTAALRATLPSDPPLPGHGGAAMHHLYSASAAQGLGPESE